MIMVRSVITNFQLFFNWLSVSLPSFPVRGDQVFVLQKPDEFYEALVNSCGKATHRISLASLYLGTGEKELRLINALKDRSVELGSSIKIKILLDNTRGSRDPTNSSRTMLLPLLEQSPRCQVALYHTPSFSPLMYKILPYRYNELIGLQHMKIYIFDDDVLISGANLSQDYFTNRQDRYYFIKNNKQIADFFDELVTIFCDASLQLNHKNVVTYKIPERKEIDVSELRAKLSDFYSSYIKKGIDHRESDTWIFPTIQVPPCYIDVDYSITKHILNSVPNNSVIHLATGYFNLDQGYIKTVLSSPAKYNFLVAHPTANGFYQSAGMSKYVPDLYTALTKKFYEKIVEKSSTDRIKILEYVRQNWTFHGKGIWLTFPGESSPQLTMIGSSNFGARSIYRDLESQIIVLTSNKNLRETLKKEQIEMYKYGVLFSKEVAETSNRKSPFWINVFVSWFRSFF